MRQARDEACVRFLRELPLSLFGLREDTAPETAPGLAAVLHQPGGNLKRARLRKLVEGDQVRKVLVRSLARRILLLAKRIICRTMSVPHRTLEIMVSMREPRSAFRS